MSKSIKEIIFFFHPSSQYCKEVFDILKQHDVPHTPFPIKSLKVAQKIKKGKYFNIESVPSLVITFNDGNIQKYEGPHCKKWLTILVEQNTQSNDEDDFVPHPDDGNLSGKSQDGQLSDGEELYSEDAEILDEQVKTPTKSLKQDNGKIDIQAVTQQMEHERNEIEKQLNTKKRRIVKH